MPFECEHPLDFHLWLWWYHYTMRYLVIGVLLLIGFWIYLSSDDEHSCGLKLRFPYMEACPRW